MSFLLDFCDMFGTVIKQLYDKAAWQLCGTIARYPANQKERCACCDGKLQPYSERADQ